MPALINITGSTMLRVLPRNALPKYAAKIYEWTIMPAPTERPNVIWQPKRKNSFRPFSANPMATASPKNDPTAMIRMGTRSAIHPVNKAIVAAPPASPAKEKDPNWASNPFSIQ